MIIRPEINKYKSKDGYHRVSIYIHAGGKRSWIATNIQTKKTLSKDDKESLKKIESRIWGFFDKNPGANAIEAKHFYLNKDSKDLTLFDGFEERINSLKKQGKEGNAAIYQTTLNSLKKYCDDIKIVKLRKEYIKDYYQKMSEDKLSVNTKSVYMRTFRALFNFYSDKWELDYYPWKRITIENKEVVPKPLSVHELNSLYKSEGRARDFFMLSFFLCGLNLVDMVYNESFKITKKRVEVIRKKVSKYEALVSVKIEPEIENLLPILNKNNPTKYEGYKSLRRRINEELKKVGQKLELSNDLTFMMARYSWLNLGKEIGYSFELLGEMVGHKNNSVTAIYMKKFSDQEKDEVNRRIIDSVLKGKIIKLERS